MGRGETASRVLQQLIGLYEDASQPDVDQRVAAWWWGAPDDEVAWALSLCRMVAPEPVAHLLYLAHVSQDIRPARATKEWGYRVAVGFVGARGSGQRRRSLVESYRPEWGHQAARDGLALAMWPHLRAQVPGIGKRCARFRCGKQAYQRVRDEVQRLACDAIADFRADLQDVLDGQFSLDFRGRWERATGHAWPKWDGATRGCAPL